MRYGPSSAALLLVVLYPLIQMPLLAEQLRGSYAANGQCFCLGEVDASLRNLIVPTPVGGQSVAQVCKRIGSGPGLESVNGLYNYPVYQDLQCGHGPFHDSAATRDADCSGTLDGTYGTCQGVGPKWDLDRAFKSRQFLAAAQPVVDDEIAFAEKPLVNRSSLKKKTSRAAEQVIENSNPSQRLNNQKSSNSLTLNKSFEGRTVTIEGQRYLQAREGLSATGGSVGSRIILDGLVFLKDDGFINPADLYVKTDPNPGRVRKTGKSDTKTTPPAAIPKPRENAAVTSNIEVEAARQAQAAKDKLQKEKDARAALVADKKAATPVLTIEEQTNNVVTAQPETVLDEVMRKYRRAELERYWITQAETQARLREQELLREQRAVQEASNQVDLSTNRAEREDPVDGASALATALRMPSNTRASSRDFGYLEAMPASFDLGGNGVVLEGSAQSHKRFQYFGRLGVAETYTNIMLGGGYYLTPRQATRMTVVLLAGLEHGDYELADELRAPGRTFNSTDSGFHLGAAARFVVNHKFELNGGLGYSTYFEGDAKMFAGAYYHATKRLDLLSRFELGDNDLLGFGIRYYY